MQALSDEEFCRRTGTSRRDPRASQTAAQLRTRMDPFDEAILLVELEGLPPVEALFNPKLIAAIVANINRIEGRRSK